MGEMFSFHLKGCGEEGNQPLVMSYKSFAEKTGFRPLNGINHWKFCFVLEEFSMIHCVRFIDLLC